MTVAPCSIYDHLFKIVIPSVLTDPERQVFQEHWVSSQLIYTQLIPSVCPVAPLTLTAFNHGTACNYFQVHIIQEDVWHFFLTHGWPHFLMQAGWEAILACVFWIIILGQISKFQASLKSPCIPGNTMRMRGRMRESETLLDLSLTRRNADWVTTQCTGCS